ncbi:MAG: HD domain-containing phosphohydrolase [Candidatus Omnitrophota bacterium]
MLKLKSIREDRINRKFLLAFILMSVAPLLMLSFIVKYLVVARSDLASIQITWLFFWLTCSALVGFLLVRGILNSFVAIAKTVRDVAEGDLSVKIQNAEDLEINELAQSIARITRQMENNIAELQKSKQLIQDVLTKVGRAVASFQNIDRFLELIVMSTMDALKADNAQLMLVDEPAQELFTRLFIGKNKISPDQERMGEGIMGFVAKEGRPFLTSPLSTEVAGEKILCVPLAYGNKIIGAFALSKEDIGGDFSDDDRLLFTDLAGQLAIAMENYRLNENAEKTYVETITALAMAVEARDQYTRGHTKRVGEYCNRLAKAFNLDGKTIKMLNDASNLHDIGKIGVPDGVLRKPTPLTVDEMNLIHEHPVIGENILRPIRSLSELCYLVRHHHEQLDGHGYPDGLKGADITLPLNIMIVADVFDAMTTDRPYRKAMSIEDAKKELQRYSGVRYDPKVVEELLKMV